MSPPDLYPWLKAGHVAAALVFAGGVLANAVLLPSAGAMALAARPVSRGAMEWSRRVTTPAMLLVWAFGLALGIRGHWFAELWLQLKLVGVVTLSAVHGVQSGALRRWAGGEPPSSIFASRKAAALALACIVAIAALATAKPG